MSTTMDMEEQQPPAKKSRMDDPSAKEDSTEISIQNDGLMESKNALLEFKVEMMAEELQKVKEENKALEKKLEETEQKAEMAKNELKEIIQKNGQKLEEFANEIALLREMQQKEEETKTTSSLDQMEKEWPPCLRLLPFETWANIFGFVPRPQLAELVPQIGDWRFAEKAQDYLHGFGLITLGDMYIRRSTSWINRKDGTPIVKLSNNDEYNAYQPDWEYPLADVPIPKNVINFALIHISYFNEYVLSFLQEFHRNSLLANVEVCFNMTNIDSDVLPQLASLLTSIDKLILFYIDSEALIQKEYSKAMLASARIFFIQYDLDDDWYSRWLCTPREDGKPRVLILDCYHERSAFAFIEHIKKDFKDSRGAASFFIHIRNFPNADNVQSDSLENSKTSERLVINGNDQPFRHVTIARHPMRATEKWIKEMGKELDSESEYRHIYIDI